MDSLVRSTIMWNAIMITRYSVSLQPIIRHSISIRAKQQASSCFSKELLTAEDSLALLLNLKIQHCGFLKGSKGSTYIPHLPVKLVFFKLYERMHLSRPPPLHNTVPQNFIALILTPTSNAGLSPLPVPSHNEETTWESCALE